MEDDTIFKKDHQTTITEKNWLNLVQVLEMI
jgi:hypothetical protein